MTRCQFERGKVRKRNAQATHYTSGWDWLSYVRMDTGSVKFATCWEAAKNKKNCENKRIRRRATNMYTWSRAERHTRKTEIWRREREGIAHHHKRAVERWANGYRTCINNSRIMLYNLLFDHGFALKHVTRTPHLRPYPRSTQLSQDGGCCCFCCCWHSQFPSVTHSPSTFATVAAVVGM